jgi:diaminohydroxyphosphoribosylaminopyrimidine deaminase/5-amino-6-(5-phosphoribosylamino)uracil reductase
MPNPPVGCVLVRDGEIVAEGWHDHIGGLHAEQMAIAEAEVRGVPTLGTTAYITPSLAITSAGRRLAQRPCSGPV